jgi:hypothetical protein
VKAFKRHKWEPVKPKNNADALMNGRHRCCVRCGVQQTMSQDHSWMRVTRTYWWPEEETRGPCEGEKQ